jgi:hypothetical protein
MRERTLKDGDKMATIAPGILQKRSSLSLSNPLGVIDIDIVIQLGCCKEEMG